MLCFPSFYFIRMIKCIFHSCQNDLHYKGKKNNKSKNSIFRKYKQIFGVNRAAMSLYCMVRRCHAYVRHVIFPLVIKIFKHIGPRSEACEGFFTEHTQSAFPPV